MLKLLSGSGVTVLVMTSPLHLEETALAATGGGTVLRLVPAADGTWSASVLARGGRRLHVALDPALGTAEVSPADAAVAVAA